MSKVLNTILVSIVLSSFTSLIARIPSRLIVEDNFVIHKNNVHQHINVESLLLSRDHKNNWMNLSPIDDGYEGMSVDKAYKEFNLDHSKRMIVAVIDSGVDIYHEEFKTQDEIKNKTEIGSRIWKNLAELNGEDGVDDDNNGYIDDKYGWNFVGTTDKQGKPVNYKDDTYEVTREYRRYLNKIKNNIKLSDEEVLYYGKVKAAYEKEESKLPKSFLALCLKIDRDDYTSNEAGLIEKENDIKKFQDYMYRKEGQYNVHPMNAKTIYMEYEPYHYDLDFDITKNRSDDPEDFSQTSYGNNDPKGPDSFHGTHVAGIIAGVRNNGNEMKGVADNVAIMPLRAVPGGDERDKDVSLAIRYAVDNGAKIINMSFGKTFSPHKDKVDEAIKYAVDNDVLIFNAAGNTATNLDDEFTFPNQFENRDRKTPIDGMIIVGSSDHKTDIDSGLSLASDFSNYGKNTVHIFAPGHYIYSSISDNNYFKLRGTSMASPAAAGAAALIWSQRPDLTNLELKDLLLNNARVYDYPTAFLPGTMKRVDLSELSISAGVIDVYNVLSKLNQERK